MGAVRPALLEDLNPMTWSVGYLNVPLSEATRALVEWRREIGRGPKTIELVGSLNAHLLLLPPLIAEAAPRELMVAFGQEWTAFFDCGLLGTEARSAIGHLSRTIGCLGLAIRNVPSIEARAGSSGKAGSVQFTLMGAARTDWLNHIRSLACVEEDRGWTFSATGTVQPFEDVKAYSARLVRDRFTPAMLQAYCRATTHRDVFDSSAYGPNAVLVNNTVIMPDKPTVLSLADARRWYGIQPKQLA